MLERRPLDSDKACAWCRNVEWHGKWVSNMYLCKFPNKFINH
jgi:hypothetical protein